MRKSVFFGLLIWSCFAEAASSLPTQVVNTLTAATRPQTGFTRIRISLSNNESQKDTVRLGSVAVCSSSVCYEAGAVSSVAIADTRDGKSSLVAELEVPFINIEAIRFKAGGGRGSLQGSIGLPIPLKLDNDFQGGDIVVVVQKQSSSGYIPVSAASNYWQPEGTTIYYNPKFATTVQLPRGTSVTMPAGAYPAVQVFIAAVHDTGGNFPLLDIYPAVKLTKSASIKLTAIDRKSRSSTPFPTPSPQSASPTGNVATSSTMSQSQPQSGNAPPTTASFEIFFTGVINPETPAATRDKNIYRSSTGGLVESSATNATCNAAGWCNCADALAYPPNQQIIFNGLQPTGNAYLDWCTAIPPYVHIVVSNLADSRERFTIKHDGKVNNGDLVLPLRRIASWNTSTQVLLNGFTWNGDQGTAAGQYGYAKGFVRDFSYGLGDNYDVGGSCGDLLTMQLPCNRMTADGNKRVMMVNATGGGSTWFDRSDTSVLSNTTSYVSSSTSIVKDGVCAADSLVSRWSAVGTTSAGRMISISSTSDGTTSAAELCAVFQALGVSNAIRLDGGPSAALVLDGILRNPLTGLYFVKYGNSRYIPYALKVSYPGY